MTQGSLLGEEVGVRETVGVFRKCQSDFLFFNELAEQRS